MSKAERSIDPADFTAIPRINDFINGLPEDVRVCSVHGEPVIIHESDFLPNPGPAAPFGKAAFVACCEPALNKVINAITMHNLQR
jgi:hypothetical protein